MGPARSFFESARDPVQGIDAGRRAPRDDDSGTSMSFQDHIIGDSMSTQLSSQSSLTALSIRELPPSERPRERLVALGACALSSVELLALLVGAGSIGGSALQVGQALLAGAGGSLRRMAMQPVAALTTTAGIGMARAVTVHAALELGRRLAAEAREDGAPVRSPRDVARLFAPRLEDLPVEEFHVAVLDAQHRLERDVTVTRGILTSSLVHPREVFREAIAERAAAVILVHNHPSGDPTPSPDDRIVTEQLVAAGKLLDIPVHDHVIIGRGRYTSFAEAGLL
jgi:DNA repair protein RadC